MLPSTPAVDTSIVKQNVLPAQVDKGHDNIAKASTSAVSGFVAEQRLSSLRDNPANAVEIEDDGRSVAAPLDPEAILPDDSSLSYIGMPHA